MRRRRTTPRCNTCRQPVVFFRSPFTSTMRTFNPTPIDGHHPLAVSAFPVMGRNAYRFAQLVEVIQVQRTCSDTDAEAEVRDMPWYQLHACEKEAPNP